MDGVEHPHGEDLYWDARWETPLMAGDTVGGLVPMHPFIPNEEPAIIQAVYNYEQLEAYRLQSMPYIYCIHYDMLQQLVEDGVQRTRAEALRC